MNVILNDKTYEVVEGTMLEQFVKSLELPSQGVAIAIDYEVIPRHQWCEILLTDGIVLMMIRAFSGG
ncbi:MAG: sulfur carrier protein ThiS [Tannerella sp.]|jgi:sulfur carrier protein|nr:sulfur carrier protein ThiS [Tannerella sp.]